MNIIELFKVQKTKEFKIIKKANKRPGSRIDFWYHIYRKWKICFFSGWVDSGYECSKGDAILKITAILEKENNRTKKKFPKPEEVFRIDKNKALLNSRSDDDEIRKLCNVIIKGK